MPEPEERIGTVRQPLVGGETISDAEREAFGLLEIGGCSASLLRNGWAITAAHCLEPRDANGNFQPDPEKPGQNIIRPLRDIVLTASWDKSQTRWAAEVFTFRPFDLALIRLSDPFNVHGFSNTFSRRIYYTNAHHDALVEKFITIFGRGINQFASGTAAAPIASQGDGVYRTAYAEVKAATPETYNYSPIKGAFIAGGDSGGPSYVYDEDGHYALLGVHSSTAMTCINGLRCGDWVGPGPVQVGYNSWQWTTSTPFATDALVSPVWKPIMDLIGPEFKNGDKAEKAPGYIGEFAKSPPGYRAIWLYGVRPEGSLEWRRYDDTWKGPRLLGAGWNAFATVIPAGGPNFYALKPDGKLLWYRHEEFNTGKDKWAPEVEVGRGWKFKEIIGGGHGVIYAITDDGKLFWYKHVGYQNGAVHWHEHKQVGRGWNNFVRVISGGNGELYAVTTEGTLVLYKHLGFDDGTDRWEKPRTIGTAETSRLNWARARQIVALGDGEFFYIDADGQVYWLKHLGKKLSSPTPDMVKIEREVEVWDGPDWMGSGFIYKSAFTILQDTRQL